MKKISLSLSALILFSSISAHATFMEFAKSNAYSPVGYSITEYTVIQEKAKDLAMERMLDRAQKKASKQCGSGEVTLSQMDCHEISMSEEFLQFCSVLVDCNAQ